MPKYRLGPSVRFDPTSRKLKSAPQFQVVRRQSNNLAFKLGFNPPLRMGEVVRYGFYLWSGNYYARTRHEAEKLYHDRWIREGLSINDPALTMNITVKLPEGYYCQEAKVEKDPVLTPGGPNVGGELISVFNPQQRTLSFSKGRPEVGHYFVSWIPPE